MIVFLIEIRPLIYGILFALIAILGGFSIQRYIRISQIRKEFRDAILAELIGQYPVTKELLGEDFFNIEITMPKIRTLCEGYAGHVNIFRRKSFQRAVEQYCNDCPKLPQIYTPSHDVKPEEIFKHNVKLLLSF